MMIHCLLHLLSSQLQHSNPTQIISFTLYLVLNYQPMSFFRHLDIQSSLRLVNYFNLSLSALALSRFLWSVHFLVKVMLKYFSLVLYLYLRFKPSQCQAQRVQNYLFINLLMNFNFRQVGHSQPYISLQHLLLLDQRRHWIRQSVGQSSCLLLF